MQALFAEQANTALESHRRLRAGPAGTAELTKLEKLSEIWDRLLPHRRLNIGGDDITVSIPDNAATYPASDMSDGERAVFYLVGQTLVAYEGSHRRRMPRRWRPFGRGIGVPHPEARSQSPSSNEGRRAIAAPFFRSARRNS